MALGLAQPQARFGSPRELLGERLREGSIYRLLADEGGRIFPDDYFADLYSSSARGRPTVPARVLATVMVLQAGSVERWSSLTRSGRYLASRVWWLIPPRARHETVVETGFTPGGVEVAERIHVAVRGTRDLLCGAKPLRVRRLHQEWGKEFDYLGPHRGPQVRSRFPRCNDGAALRPPALSN